MASYFGTDTGYSSIANNYLYLQVTDCDKIYNYDITTQQLRQNGIPENLFDNCLNATDFTNCFNSCYQLTGNAPALWLRPGVTGSGCFYGCYNLANYADIPANWK
jgi:hypothetical protein